MLSKVLSGEAAKPIEWLPVSARPARPAAQEPGEDDIEGRLRVERESAFQAGKQAGFDQARAEVEVLKGQLARNLSDLASMKARLRAEAEQDIIRLSLAIARKILHRETCVDRDAIAGVLKAALSRLAMRESQRVMVHPNDADSLRRHLAASGLSAAVEVVGDGALAAGSLIIETTRGAIDASIDSQLAEIERGFTDLLERR